MDQLPGEPILYLADSARAPYGPKPIAEVRANALECLDRLADEGVKLLVIACNSASAAMLHDARERYNVPVVEVIRPATRRAAKVTKSGRIGVLSTVATARSGAYVDAFVAAPHVQVTSQACPRFVEFVEAGVTAGPDLMAAAREYLAPLAAAHVDTVVLGCTHYPLLTGVISLVMDHLTDGAPVVLVSSAEETAQEVYRQLATIQSLRATEADVHHQFLTTGDPTQFGQLARRFLGPEASTVTHAWSTQCD